MHSIINIHLFHYNLGFPGTVLTPSLLHTFIIYFTIVNTNDHPISLSKNYGSSDYSSLIRAEASPNSDSRRLINNQSILVGMPVSNDYELERLLGGFLGKETSFNESSSDALFLMRIWEMITHSNLRLNHPKLQGI